MSIPKIGRRAAPVCIIAAGCLWGTTGLFIRHLNVVGLHSMQIAELRSVITAVVMFVLLLCIQPNMLQVKWKDLWCFAGTGLLSVLFFNYCYFSTIEESSLSVAATLLYTSPVFVMLLSLLLFREKITGIKLGALALAFGGCVLVSGVLTGTQSLSVKGLLLGLGSGLGYALYSIFSRYAIQKGYESLTITAYTFLFAAVGGAFLTDYSEVTQAFSSSTWNVLLYVVLYALVTTVAPYILYTAGLRNVENGRASVMAAVEPVCATLLGLVVFHEIPDLPATVGILLVLAALVLLNLPARKKSV